MSISELKLRMGRLLNAEFREEDLTQLFLGLRDKAHGDEIIKEIGDCVAHQGERTKGAMTKRLNLFFLSLGVYIDLLGRSQFDFSNMHSSMPRVAKFNLESMSPSHIKNSFGMSKQQAKKTLDLAIQEIYALNGKLSFQKNASPSLKEFFLFCANSITVQSFLSDEKLWKSFVWVITRNGLVKESDKKVLSLFRPALILFVVSKLHKSVYRTEDGRYVLLCISSNAGRIYVDASTQISNDHPKDYFTNKAAYISFGFFSTELIADEWCIGKIITNKVPNWRHVYEVKNGPKLARIGSVWPGEI